MNPAAVPALDALPLPGPVWLFKLLLHLTFVLHLVAMNFLLGGATIAVVERIRGRTRPASRELARWIERRLPVTMAFTVTLGVAPLLFLQAMYGHLFYTSSVLMAWPWLLVIPLVIVTYYLAYLLSFKGDEASEGLRLAGWIVAIALVVIAFIYVNNMSLAIRPDSWAGKYFASARGNQLNLGDRTLWPRFLHMIAAAMAVAGLIVAWFGARRMAHDDPHGAAMHRVGTVWFLVPTAGQFVFGLWFLISLPKDVMMTFMGGSALGTALLALAVLLPIAMLLLQALAFRSPSPLSMTSITATLLLVTVVAMVLLRDLVRDAMLDPVFHLDTIAVQPQWSVFAPFALLLVVALAVTGWMTKVLLQASPAKR
jgi:hypothetical protein